MAREMKDSGVKWIGQIPADWSVEKLKFIASFCQEKYREDLGALVYVGLENIVSWNGKLIETESEYDRGQSILFSQNDILWGKLRPYLAKVFHCQESGCCSGEFCVIRPQLSIDIRFLWNTLISVGFVSAVDQSTYGTKMPRANADFIKNMLIPIPPGPEQKNIGAFLDRKCKEIDAVLEKTRTSIEEYKKLKQAIITQVVTKGVRGDRPMKESGIDWADVIPEEIKISRLGLHYDIILGKMLCSAQVDDSYTLEPYYCAADVHFEGISDSERKMMWFSPAEKELYLVQRNDLLVVEGGAGAGGCAVVTDGETPTYIQNSIMIVRAKHSGDCRYVRYWLECLVRQGYIDVVCNKATIPHFTKDKLAAVPYFVFSEQERNEIADYLDEQCRNINSQVEKEECLLHEFESYKKSLIYEYVTGKKEVQQKQQVKEMVVYPFFPAVFQATNPRFAQAILMSKVLDSCKVKMGRVKLEKMMFVLENSIGFDFDTEYVREAAGPLDKSIYECEKIISRKNKWFTIRESKYGISYKPTSEHSKYKKYYTQYFSDYEDAINKVISIFHDFDADQAEVIATVYGAWNDCIIDKQSYTDNDIVDEVLNHWHPKKRRFPKDMWLRAIQRMRELDLVPHGYGRHTVIKQN